VIEWRKSSHSGGVNDEACVELARTGGAVIAVRDSKAPDGPRFAFSAPAFSDLLKRIKRNELDL
jgi:Domain of unknown function (DUF397)